MDLSMTPEELQTAYSQLVDNATSSTAPPVSGNATAPAAGNTTAPAAGAGNSTTTLSDVGGDLLWKGPVLVGTPPKEFQVDLVKWSAEARIVV